MSAFITRRGGGGESEVITGSFTPTSATTVTIADLVGKSRFVISSPITGYTQEGIVAIIYEDGVIQQYYKSLNSSGSQATYIYLDSSESAAYFDPDTGTIDVSVINANRTFNTSKTYEYAIFG